MGMSYPSLRDDPPSTRDPSAVVRRAAFLAMLFETMTPSETTFADYDAWMTVFDANVDATAAVCGPEANPADFEPLDL